jgi:hypothetical protein
MSLPQPQLQNVTQLGAIATHLAGIEANHLCDFSWRLNFNFDRTIPPDAF